jgi:type VI protein secretion system component VasF
MANDLEALEPANERAERRAEHAQHKENSQPVRLVEHGVNPATQLWTALFGVAVCLSHWIIR